MTLLNALNEKLNEIKGDGYAILVQNGLDRNNVVEDQ